MLVGLEKQDQNLSLVPGHVIDSGMSCYITMRVAMVVLYSLRFNEIIHFEAIPSALTLFLSKHFTRPSHHRGIDDCFVAQTERIVYIGD